MKACEKSIGRRYKEKEDLLIDDPFLNDYTKIIQSRAYRRLAYKTQVISLPTNPHVRTRLLHTNEVIAISAGIAKRLGLNINLCIAIAAGHDIGHTPYGHLGERVLSEFSGKPFKHHINSVVVAQHVERKGKGLNLTYEVLEGILNHARGTGKLTIDKNKHQEYSAVMFADKIAYTFSDLNDAMRYGYIDQNKIPACALSLGENQRERTNNAVKALISESQKKGFVQFSEGKVFQNFDELRKFLCEEFYYKVDWLLQEKILRRLCEYFSNDNKFSNVDPIIAVSLLTDKEANYFGRFLLNSRKPSADQIKHLGIVEILPYLGNKSIDYTDPDLDWI